MTRNMYPKLDIITAAYDGSIAVDIGDLMYHDTDDAKPASSQADQLSEAANQALFAPRFLGVAVERHLSTDAAGDVDVALEWVGEMPCASSTFEVGDLVTVDEASSGTALEDQKLVKTTDPGLAIGYVAKRYASATTTVLVVLKSRVIDRLEEVQGSSAVETVAATGSAQSDAAAVSKDLVLVSAADATKGVKLPVPYPGRKVTIKNGANAVLKVYPGTDGAINAIAANGAISMAAYTCATFHGYSATQWYTAPLLPS